MDVARDSTLLALNEIVANDRAAAARVREILQRIVRRLEQSTHAMEWEVVPMSTFSGPRQESIQSCWVFAIRPHAATGPERHRNSHQRTLSLVGAGAFELYDEGAWQRHALLSDGDGALATRWVSIPPSTWHRLVVGPEPWGVLSFHSVAPEELMEEVPLDPGNLDGETREERYAGRR